TGNLVYRILLDVPISKNWDQLDIALQNADSATAYNLVVGNIPNGKQTPWVLAIIASSLRSVSRGSPPDADKVLVMDYAYPSGHLETLFRAELDIPIRPGDWATLRNSVCSFDRASAYDVVLSNIDSTKRSPAVLGMLDAIRAAKA